MIVTIPSQHSLWEETWLTAENPQILVKHYILFSHTCQWVHRESTPMISEMIESPYLTSQATHIFTGHFKTHLIQLSIVEPVSTILIPGTVLLKLWTVFKSFHVCDAANDKYYYILRSEDEIHYYKTGVSKQKAQKAQRKSLLHFVLYIIVKIKFP